MAEKIVCPVCNGGKERKSCVACKGVGFLTAPKPPKSVYDKDGRMKAAAHVLRNAGYTLREIAAILGYKGPQSIAHLLNKKS